jgi:hypothetical protein
MFDARAPQPNSQYPPDRLHTATRVLASSHTNGSRPDIGHHVFPRLS